MTIYEDFEKISTTTKLFDEFRDWTSEAASNAFVMLQNIQAELENTVSSTVASSLLSAVEGFKDTLITLNDTSLFDPILTQLRTTMKYPASPSKGFFQFLIDYLANSSDYTGVITLTNGANTIAGVGTAFLTELKGGANGDYLYLEQDGITARIRITNITNDTTATLAANYAGTAVGTDVRICRTVKSRGVSKAVIYGDSLGNKGKMFYVTTDKWGFEIETPKNPDSFIFKIRSSQDYSGIYDIKCLSGREINSIDPNGCYPTSEPSSIIIDNTESTGILDASAATFPYNSAGSSTLAIAGWYSAAWAGAALSNTEFAHPEVGSKTTTAWTGTGSSLDLDATHNMKIKLSKSNSVFSEDIRYFMLAVYRYATITTTGDLKFDVGGITETFDGQPSLTGNMTVINTNTTVNGTATLFLEEVSIGDHIKLDIHAAGAWSEVESIESNTELTLVAGGYLGANGGPAAASVYETGWHWKFIDMGFYNDFVGEADLEAEIDLSGVISGNIFIDTFNIFSTFYISSMGLWFRWFAGAIDFVYGDQIQVDVAIPADSKISRWMADGYKLSLPHDAANFTFMDPA